jgi:hypothetical protein
MAGEDLIAPLVAAKQPAYAPPIEAAKAVGAFVAGGISTAAVLIAFGAALWVAARPKWAAWGVRAAAAVFIVSMGVQAGKLLPLVPRAEAIRLPSMLKGIASELRAGAPKPRILRFPFATAAFETDAAREAVAFNDTAVENVATMHGFAQAPGYDPMRSPRLIRTMKAGQQNQKHMLDLFDIRYVVSHQSYPNEVPDGMEISGRLPEESAALWRDLGVRPRAFVTSKLAFAPDDEKMLEAMYQGPGDLDLIHLEGATPTTLPAADAHAVPCDVRSPKPERVELQCPTSAGGYAVLLDAWAPGWSATLDGAPAEIERADMVVRAVRVGPGEHKITFSYSTPGLRVGALLSVVAWAAAVLLAQRARGAPSDA